MKKYIFILILAAISVAGMSQVTRTATINTGYSMLSKAMSFTAADSVVTSDSLTITITNIQKYMQFQTFTTTLTDVDGGSPSVTITAYGKTSSGGSWLNIGSINTWTSSSNNPVVITATTPNNYNYLKISYVASGATQHVKVATLDVRTANCYDIPANSGTLTISRATSGTVSLTAADNDANANLTVKAGGTGTLTLGQSLGATTLTGSAVNINAALNIATNINTSTSTGALSLGGGSGTVAVNSTTWDVTTAGVATGLTAVTVTNDGDNIILDPRTDLHAIDVQINSASKFSVDSTGAVASAGAITPAGGIVLPSASTVFWAQSGAVNAATVGGDSAGVAGRRYWVELEVPYNTTLTGISYLIGSVGGTDSVVVQLCNSAGTQVATTRAPGTAAALVSTAATFQAVPFTTPYAATAGKYYAVVQLSGTTAKLRTHSITGCKFIAGSAAGAWGTKADITPGTSYTVGKAPFLMTY